MKNNQARGRALIICILLFCAIAPGVSARGVGSEHFSPKQHTPEIGPRRFVAYNPNIAAYPTCTDIPLPEAYLYSAATADAVWVPEHENFAALVANEVNVSTSAAYDWDGLSQEVTPMLEAFYESSDWVEEVINSVLPTASTIIHDITVNESWFEDTEPWELHWAHAIVPITVTDATTGEESQRFYVEHKVVIQQVAPLYASVDITLRDGRDYHLVISASNIQFSTEFATSVYGTVDFATADVGSREDVMVGAGKTFFLNDDGPVVSLSESQIHFTDSSEFRVEEAYRINEKGGYDDIKDPSIVGFLVQMSMIPIENYVLEDIEHIWDDDEQELFLERLLEVLGVFRMRELAVHIPSFTSLETLFLRHIRYDDGLTGMVCDNHITARQPISPFHFLHGMWVYNGEIFTRE